MCHDREIPEWAQKLSQQIIKGTGYTKEKGGVIDQRGSSLFLPKHCHGLCLFLRYLYTFTMIPFFALLAPDHELPSIWLPTNTIKLISIPPLIYDAPLLLGISCPLNDLLTQFLGPLWNLAVDLPGAEWL
jgi:hypothetical protein